MLFNWDDIRDRVWAWAERHGYRTLQRVVLRLDTVVGSAKKQFRLFATPQETLQPMLIEERLVDESELPPDIREQLASRKRVEMDITERL